MSPTDNSQVRDTQKNKQPCKHHHHGDGATCPTSSVDLMMQGPWRGYGGLAHIFSVFVATGFYYSIHYINVDNY